MNQDFSKKALPHIIAIISFFVISFVYFSPTLDGKELSAHDVESWKGMSKEIRDYNDTHEDVALWTGRMFAGMPAYQISLKKTDNVLVLFHKLLNVFPYVVFILFLYLIGFYILLQAYKFNPWLSIVFSIGFAFASYNFIVLTAGHITKAITIAYMAPIVGSIVMTFRSNKYLGASLAALFIGLGVLANHFQITYYTVIMLLVFGVSEFIFAIKEKKTKQFFISVLLLLAAGGIGVGINITNLLTTKEYSEYTMRGKSNGLTIDKASSQEGLNKEYITQWSYGIDETMTLLIPNFKGGASQGNLSPDSHTAAKLREQGVADVDDIMARTPMPTYWGTQPMTSGPVYIGAIICFLFVLGLLIVEGKNKWWLLAVTVLSILLSWGKNFMPFTEFFIDYVPLYNMFRAVSMILVLAGFSMALLGALSLKTLFSNELSAEKKKKSLYLAAGITGGISLLFAIIPSIAGDFKSASDAMLTQYGYPQFILETLPLDRQALLQSDAFRSLIFIALAFVVLWLFVAKNLKAHFVYLALAVLLLADMVPVAKRYLNDKNFTAKQIGGHFTPSAADKSILEDRSQFRVLDITVDIFNSSKPSYFHNTIGGYHAAKLRRYQELINNHLSREISNIGASFQSAQKAQSMEPIMNQMAQSQVLNMLNMKYIIFSPEQNPITNPFANGNAWFVNDFSVAQTADEEMLKLGTLDTKHQLVVDKEFAAMLPESIVEDSTASIVETSYSPNIIKYQSNATTQQVAVFSEVYYDKGWNAYVDGVNVPYFRANYLLRALVIEAGVHEIEFRFEPKSYTVGSTIALISSVLLILTLLAALYYEFKKKRTEA